MRDFGPQNALLTFAGGIEYFILASVSKKALSPIARISLNRRLDIYL
jgi:hypothetical protein